MKTMRNMALPAALLIGTVAFGLAHSTSVAGQTTLDAQARIEDAMRAGPSAIAQDATILDWTQDAAGNFVVLRPGNNGWSCFPDTPGTPSDDPMCADATWVDLMKALMANKTPPPTKTLGIAYMLQGGTDPSNTDPFATKPAPDGGWLTTPPHLMLLLPGKLDPTVYSTVYANGGPWIMWPGTPYEHLMAPVSDLLKPGH